MSSSDIHSAIKTERLCKSYRIYRDPKDRLKQFFWGRWHRYFGEFCALHPVSFSIKKGECVGFVGRNGSGKSTLLQILAGTLSPSSGIFEARGRIAALLELGAGFNLEFTGRENVVLNASILGLARQEIQERLPAIFAFAEIGDFIEQPVKTYSSGMYIRLAFSVAIHVDPDILLVDEALAVGDTPFQYKCMNKIEELRDRGVSIVFVSHDLSAIKRFCDRAGWLHEGSLISYGNAVEVVDKYEDFLRQEMRTYAKPEKGSFECGSVDQEENEIDNQEQVHATLLNGELLDSRGTAINHVVTGSAVRFRITYEVFKEPPKGLVVGAAIFRSDDLYVCGVNTQIDRFKVPDEVGVHTVTLKYDPFRVLPGSYYIKMGIFDHTCLIRWDFEHRACEFQVSSPYLADGVVLLEHCWENEELYPKK